jgi:hypothetical protein
MPRPTLSFANLTSLLALVVALGGGAYAVASASPERGKDAAVLIGCVDKQTGDLRIVKRKCARGERKLSWNKRGPVGPVGPAGATGASGATKVVVRTDTGEAVPSGTFTNGFAKCQPGEKAVGGGAGFGTFSGSEVLIFSYPIDQDGSRSVNGAVPVGWRAGLANNSAPAKTPYFYVVCAAP